MRSIYLNDDGDIEFSNMKDLKFVDDTDEIAQRLKLSIVTELKEWFLDMNFGIDWLPMLSENADELEYRRKLLRVLNDDPAVTKVLDLTFNFDREQRKLNVDFMVQIGEDELQESVVIE